MPGSRWLTAAIVALGVFMRADAQTYVIVVDADGRPVLGLSTEDFSLRDGGVKQSLDDVVPATAPLAIAVVVDGVEASERADVVAAIAGAAARLAAASSRHRIGLLDVPASGASAPALIDLSSDRAAVDAALTRVLRHKRPLIDSVIEASQALQDAPTDRLAVLAIVKRRGGDGAVEQAALLTDALVENRVSLWTIEAGPAQKTALDKAFDDATAAGGAMREVVAAPHAMPDAASRIIDLLLSQYVATYQWPNPMLSLVSIVIRHERGTVLATSWMR